MLQAWFMLSFGVQQVYALQELVGRAVPVPEPGIEIRRAGPGDRETLEAFSELIWQHQAQAPVWGITLPERRTSLRADYGNLVADAEATLWLGYAGGQPAGFHAYLPAEVADDDIMTPEHCVELCVASTIPDARGRGIGLALTHHGLAQAQIAGYRYCLTNWRSTNLLSSRFWPRRGFQPVAYRLVQRIDPRISWAGVP
jgi:ribosomal protein S18 acetylase RimI-like enzyme